MHGTMPKIERTNSSVSTARAQAITKTSAVPVAPASPPPAATYAGQAAPTKELIPNGKPVAKSASPNALWGEQPKPVSLDREAFAKLPPAEQREVLKKAAVEREQLGGEINARVEHLDRKWKNSRLVTRTEALREYQERSGHLHPRRRRDLDKLLVRSEAAQVRINELRAKVDALPKTPEAKKQQAALRSELAKELRRARDEQSKVVKEATAIVDGDGLKVDRLAVTEQVIDPTAPAPGSGDSLLDKVVRFFHLDTFINWVADTFSNVVSDFAEKANDATEQELKTQSADATKRIETNLQLDRLRADLQFLANTADVVAAS